MMGDRVEDFLSREKDRFAEFDGESDMDSRIIADNNGESSVNEGNSLPADVPDKIRKWREDQQSRLKDKDSAEEKAKEELKRQAAKELIEWSTYHEESIVKMKLLNRESAKNAEKENICLSETDVSMDGTTEWERIAKLCDFTTQSTKVSKSQKDNSRMRTIILQLKQNPIEKP